MIWCDIARIRLIPPFSRPWNMAHLAWGAAGCGGVLARTRAKVWQTGRLDNEEEGCARIPEIAADVIRQSALG